MQFLNDSHVAFSVYSLCCETFKHISIMGFFSPSLICLAMRLCKVVYIDNFVMQFTPPSWRGSLLVK